MCCDNFSIASPQAAGACGNDYDEPIPVVLGMAMVASGTWAGEGTVID
jgi:hypothetical protein